MTTVKTEVAFTPGPLEWSDGKTLTLDQTMVFGKGYDFEGMELMAEEAETALGRVVVWPDCLGGSTNWSLYGGPLGIFEQGFPSRDAVKSEVQAMHDAALARARGDAPSSKGDAA